MTQIVLVGNPNCGKTTLFNALTGDNQRVGNWPGVTVEQKCGQFWIGETAFQVMDLPGVYSLACPADGCSPDERIAAEALVSLDIDIIINVIDACNLERHLYLTSQLLELGKPVLLVMNMMDIAAQRGIDIQVAALSKQLNCPVIPMQAHKQIGLQALHQALLAPLTAATPLAFSLPPSVESMLEAVEQRLTAIANRPASQIRYTAWRMLEGDQLLMRTDGPIMLEAADPDVDILLADARYQKIHQLVGLSQTKRSDASEHFTARIDRVVLNRFLAFPIFLGMMYLMFLFAINIGGAFQDFFDISTNTIFVQGSAWLLNQCHAPQWLIALIAKGVGVGINTTLTFIPVIAAMFFFLALLEASGYMARAAFVVDKAMRAMGLPGKSFVPMIVGFGCNVPAIMSARTLDSERDRLLTVLMSPFMSCSARLAIYAVFVAAFFPHGGQNVVFALYLIGILMAVLTGYMLRKTILKGQASPLVLELPAYHKPSLKRLCRETGLRLRYFIVRAGKMIIPVCVLLGGLNALTVQGGISMGDASTQSVLSWLGQWLTPVFKPMGLTADNWPATVGLLTGMLAKEVVVGTLNSLYAQLGHLNLAGADDFNFWGGLAQAFWTIPHNLASLGDAIVNPILASAPDSQLSQSVYGMMASRFDGQAGAFAYLLFILLYIPCVSTMAAIRQESSRALMWFSVLWSLLVAYAAAVVFYQLATCIAHPLLSVAWIVGLIAFSLFFVYCAGSKKFNLGRAHVITNP